MSRFPYAVTSGARIPHEPNPAHWVPNIWVLQGGPSGPAPDTPPWNFTSNNRVVDVPDSQGGAGNHYQGSVYSDLPQSSGKRYYELLISGAVSFQAPSPTQFSYGIVGDGFNQSGASTAFAGSQSWGYNFNFPPTEGEYRGDNGVGGTTIISGLPAPVTNGVVMVAVDIDAHELWMGYDGAWFTGDPGLGTSPIATGMPGTIYNPGFAAQMSYAGATLRSTASTFSYPIPAGFRSWASVD